MADNVAVTPGAGATIATDDVGGVQHQAVKVEFGTDGVATMVSSSDPLPVTAPAAARTTHSIAASIQTDVINEGLTLLTPKFFSETVTASDTDEELVAAVTGPSKRIRILSLVVHCAGTATTCTFESGTATRIHKVPAGANGGQVLGFNPVGWFQTAAGSSLTVTTGTGSDTEISGTYIEVS
jgi:hypothetical protein